MGWEQTRKKKSAKNILKDKTKTEKWWQEGLAQVHEYPPKPFKNHHLAILHLLLELELKEMLLIDDKLDNVVEAVGRGVAGVFVPGDKALQWTDLRKIYTSVSEIEGLQEED